MSIHSNARVVVQDDYSFIIPITDTTKQYDVACEIKRNKVKEISLTPVRPHVHGLMVAFHIPGNMGKGR